MTCNAMYASLTTCHRVSVIWATSRFTRPSWGYRISKGATTVWESFEDNSHSLNMKMFGSTEKFFYKDLAGIGLAGPGFKQITIKPCPVGDLTYVRASLKTVQGVIAVDWKKGRKSFGMKVTIPPNTTAQISVPTMGLKEIAVTCNRSGPCATGVTESHEPVWKAGKFLPGVPGITAGSETDEYVAFDVGSGTFRRLLHGLPSVQSGAGGKFFRWPAAT